MKLIIFTDGASRGNPGPASFGFTISDSKGKLVFEAGRYIGETTNNVAEYTAVLEALKWVSKNIARRPAKGGKESVDIRFYADSKLVAEQLSGRYKIKAPHLRPIFDEIRGLVMELGGISFTHVPREENKAADKLANEALDNR